MIKKKKKKLSTPWCCLSFKKQRGNAQKAQIRKGRAKKSKKKRRVRGERTMTPLAPLVLMGLLSLGSAQLQFNKTGDVTKTVCNDSILLPCYVTNLQLHNLAAMFVEWKFNDQRFYHFDGNRNSTNANANFSSASLNLAGVPRGDASLTISDARQAVAGKYTCDVTEDSRTGAISVSLQYSQVVMFQLKESVPIAFLLCLAVVGFWVHFGITFLSFYKPKPPAVKGLAVAGTILTILLVVGLALLFSCDYSVASAAGLGIAVIPTLAMVLVLQHFLYPSNVVLWIFLALKIVGFVIAVVGCGLCLAACPPTQAVLLLSGIVIFAAFVFANLVYSLLKAIHPKEVV